MKKLIKIKMFTTLKYDKSILKGGYEYFITYVENCGNYTTEFYKLWDFRRKCWLVFQGERHYGMKASNLRVWDFATLISHKYLHDKKEVNSYICSYYHSHDQDARCNASYGRTSCGEIIEGKSLYVFHTYRGVKEFNNLQRYIIPYKPKSRVIAIEEYTGDICNLI